MVVAPVPIQMLEVILLTNVNNLLNTYNSACEIFAFTCLHGREFKLSPFYGVKDSKKSLGPLSC